MRTTIDIDDDVLAAAKDLARAEGRTMGQIISDLARRGLMAPGADALAMPGFAEAQAAFNASTWPTLPGRAGVIVTSEMIERIEAELDRDDAMPVAFAADGSFQPRFGVSGDAAPVTPANATAAGGIRRRKARE